MAFDNLMTLRAQAINVEDYTAAASFYTNDGLLAGPFGAFKGAEKIQGFFASLRPTVTQYDYDYRRCNADDCTFKGQYDFSELGKYDFKITLDDGKIVEEVVTEPDAYDVE